LKTIIFKCIQFMQEVLQLGALKKLSFQCIVIMLIKLNNFFNLEHLEKSKFCSLINSLVDVGNLSIQNTLTNQVLEVRLIDQLM
jgi:hypothetical protein